MASNYQRTEYRHRSDEQSGSYNYETGPGQTSTTTTTTYRSSVGPRSNTVTQTRTARTAYNISSTRIPSFTPTLRSLTAQSSALVPTSSNAVVSAINAARLRDKKDLVDLNDKFAKYVEKIRFLDAQNRKLRKELEALENRATPRTSHIRDMYEIEMTAAQQLLDQTRHDLDAARALREKNGGDLKRSRAQYDANVGARQTDQREVETLQRRLAENESQIALLRRRLEDIEDEIRLYKDETQRVTSEINRLQNDIEQQGVLRNAAEQDRFAVEEELSVLKQQQQDRLVAEQPGYVSADLDPSKFFRNELASAIQEIRREYEDEMKDYQSRLQFQYDLLVNRYPQLNAARLPTSAPADDPNDRRRRQIHEQLLTERDHSRRYLAEQETLTAQINNLRQDIAKIDGQARSTDQSLDEDFARLRERRDRVEQEYNQVAALRTNLQQEIGRYRELLEGQDGLQGCVQRIELQAQGALPSTNEAMRRANPLPSSQSSTATPSGSIRRSYIGQSSSYQARPIPATAPPMNPSSGQSGSGSSVYQRLADPPRRQPSADEPRMARSPSRESSGDYYAQRENIVQMGSSSNRSSQIYERSYTSRSSLPRSQSRQDDPADSQYDTYENI